MLLKQHGGRTRSEEDKDDKSDCLNYSEGTGLEQINDKALSHLDSIAEEDLGSKVKNLLRKFVLAKK